MRLRILLEAHRSVRVPLNHQDLLRGVLYRLLGEGNADYAHFLHEEGYAVPVEEKAERADSRRYKMFVFSTLQAPRARRRIEGSDLVIFPGPVEWWIASPVEEFLRTEIRGLLSAATQLRVGNAASFRVVGAEAFPVPRFASVQGFTCLTPIVAAVPEPGRSTPRYLRPHDETDFSQAIRRNLLRKYAALNGGAPPADDRLELRFNGAYLARQSHGGTKKITIKGTDVIGAFAPFTLTGSPKLMAVAWACGLGEKNGSGFGMIEADYRAIVSDDNARAEGSFNG